MIDSIFLDNYKHFQAFKVDKLKRLNLISGGNNTGKTSLLEAIFFFYDRASPETFLKQLSLRGVHSVQLNNGTPIWQSMFYNFDLERKITISIDDSGHTEKALYSHEKNARNMIVASQQGHQPIAAQSSLDLNLTSLRSQFSSGRKSTGESYLYVQNEQINLTFKSMQPARKEIVFVNSSTKGNMPNDAERLGTIEIEGDTDEITNALKLIEPRLKGLSIVPQGQQSFIYGDIGLSKKIPIHQMGEGIGKLLSILVTIATTKDGVVCVDEIENGIHYALFPKVWEIIDTIALRNNCQLFVTTHNHDVLKGLSAYNNESQFDHFSYIRLDWVKGSITPKFYSADMLFAAIERDWEVR